jgi:hypothetical protein
MSGVESGLFTVLYYGALGLAVWALADALYRPAAYFPAAGKLTKPAWAGITGVSLVFIYLFFLQLFGIVAIVASIVYLVDVRPALRGLRPGNGPYG